MIYVTTELGVRGDDDDVHIERATSFGAVIATQNQRDFAPLHHRRQVERRPHAGILLLPQREYIGRKIERLERAARLLTPEAAHDQLINLGGFDTEENGVAYVVSLTPRA